MFGLLEFMSMNLNYFRYGAQQWEKNHEVDPNSWRIMACYCCCNLLFSLLLFPFPLFFSSCGTPLMIQLRKYLRHQLGVYHRIVYHGFMCLTLHCMIQMLL